jgi:hypothetical protein
VEREQREPRHRRGEVVIAGQCVAAGGGEGLDDDVAGERVARRLGLARAVEDPAIARSTCTAKSAPSAMS